MTKRPPYPSFQIPFQEVWRWNREGTPDSIRKAEEKAREFKVYYPLVLPIRHELALALVRQKDRRAESIAELEQAGRDFTTLDEDTLCLWGRCYKDEGDERLTQRRLAEAEDHYERAEDKYDKAYGIREDRFPGINVAALRWIRASLKWELAAIHSEKAESERKSAQQLMKDARDMAVRLLQQRRTWQQRLQDDKIWISATAGEAYLIAGEWAQAAEQYRLALDPANKSQPFHRDSMKRQVQRVTDGYRRLGLAVGAPFDDPDAFFSL